MTPYQIKRGDKYRGRRVLDRASNTYIGVVTQHLNDDLWYFHELVEDAPDGVAEDASGRSFTMDDAAGQLHDMWLFEQAESRVPL